MIAVGTERLFMADLVSRQIALSFKASRSNGVKPYPNGAGSKDGFLLYEYFIKLLSSD